MAITVIDNLKKRIVKLNGKPTGNTVGVSIPRKAVVEHGLEPGDMVNVSITKSE